MSIVQIAGRVCLTMKIDRMRNRRVTPNICNSKHTFVPFFLSNEKRVNRADTGWLLVWLPRHIPHSLCFITFGRLREANQSGKDTRPDSFLEHRPTLFWSAALEHITPRSSCSRASFSKTTGLLSALVSFRTWFHSPPTSDCNSILHSHFYLDLPLDSHLLPPTLSLSPRFSLHFFLFCPLLLPARPGCNAKETLRQISDLLLASRHPLLFNIIIKDTRRVLPYRSQSSSQYWSWFSQLVRQIKAAYQLLHASAKFTLNVTSVRTLFR